MEMTNLPSVDPRKLGEALRSARERRGLTQEDAAGYIGVGRTTMVAIEKGTRSVSPEEIITLARAYGREVSDLIRDRPHIAHFQVQYRGPREATEEERKQIQAYEHQFEDLCKDYVELEEILGVSAERDYPQEYRVNGVPPRQAAEEVAQKERNRLGLGTGPLGDFRKILEEKVGIRIFYIEMRPTSFSEMYYYDDDVGACIAVNKLHPPERRLWSLAHGYIHFLVHRYEPTAFVEGDYERLPAREQLADYGALFLTMPSTEVLERYNRLIRTKQHPTPADLCVLADYFGVSVAAVTRRLEEMRILPAGTWNKLKDRGFKVREAQRALGIERSDSSAHMLPLRYQYLALEALERGEISEGRFAKFMRCDRLEARTIMERLREHTQGITDETLVDLDVSKPLGAE